VALTFSGLVVAQPASAQPASVVVDDAELCGLTGDLGDGLGQVDPAVAGPQQLEAELGRADAELQRAQAVAPTRSSTPPRCKRPTSASPPTAQEVCRPGR
jgi:hypothetical protein